MRSTWLDTPAYPHVFQPSSELLTIVRVIVVFKDGTPSLELLLEVAEPLGLRMTRLPFGVIGHSNAETDLLALLVLIHVLIQWEIQRCWKVMVQTGVVTYTTWDLVMVILLWLQNIGRCCDKELTGPIFDSTLVLVIDIGLLQSRRADATVTSAMERLRHRSHVEGVEMSGLRRVQGQLVYESRWARDAGAARIRRGHDAGAGSMRRVRDAGAPSIRRGHDARAGCIRRAHDAGEARFWRNPYDIACPYSCCHFLSLYFRTPRSLLSVFSLPLLDPVCFAASFADSSTMSGRGSDDFDLPPRACFEMSFDVLRFFKCVAWFPHFGLLH